MIDDRLSRDAPDSQIKRRNRDAHLRREAAASTVVDTVNDGAGATAAPSSFRSSDEGADEHIVPDSLEDVVARGHRTLRFPTLLETQFQADTLESRRQLLIVCGLIGIISIYFGTANVAAIYPDVVATALRVAHQNLVAGALGLAVLLTIPKPWRRAWQAECVTALIAVGTCAGLINNCVISRADTTFTHSVAIVSVVMYTCIAARQRFRWSMACVLLSFGGYVTFVKGFTPHQELIVAANIKLMVLSFAFALTANYAFEHRERRNWLLRKLEEQRRAALVEASERLRRLSVLDPLTGLLNRRQFDIDLRMAWDQAAKNQQPVALLMVDVDCFKRYNDTYGHPAGDACLIQVAQALTRVAQAHGGTASRLGGEEFGLLLPGRTLDQAMQAALALCLNVRDANMAHRASTVAAHVTVSVGAAQGWPTEGDEPQVVLQLADGALYQAKAAGRDRACAASASTHAAEAWATPVPQPPGHAACDAEPPTPNRPQPDQPKAQESASDYIATLHSKFRWLSFPSTQEADYRHHDAAERRQQLVSMAVLGLVIYNVYFMTSRVMFPDLQAGALMVQLGLSAFLLALTLLIHKLKRLRPWWREAVFSVGTSVAGFLTVWVLSQSHHMSALSFSVCLALIPLFSGAGARQPFWFTCVPAVTTCAAAALLLKPVGAQQTLVFHDNLLMIVNNTVFALILAYTLEHGARKEWLLAKIERLQRKALMTATRRLHELSTLDPLTGLCNRRQFEDDFDRIWAESLRDQRPLAMLIVDVDFFKLYNDGYGHPAGDRCLKQVAAALSQTAQAHKGLAARLGGEEFGILLTDATVEQAMRAGEDMCAAVREAGMEHRHSKVARHVTVSVGVASLLPAEGLSRKLLMATADDALYQTKLAGRDGVAAPNVPTCPTREVATESMSETLA